MNFKIENIKKILILITLVMVVVTIHQVTTTYAIFYSEANAELTQKIGKWNISVNNTDITKGITQEFVIENLNIIKSQYTTNNKLAPGMHGDFEININPNDTQVSIRYDLSIDSESITNSKINITSVEESEQGNKIFRTEENSYTGVITLSDIQNKKTNKIKITFNWENDEENNEEDTELGTKVNSKVEIPIILNLTQYMGEDITEI